jgi:hypothetical protein
MGIDGTPNPTRHRTSTTRAARVRKRRPVHAITKNLYTAEGGVNMEQNHKFTGRRILAAAALAAAATCGGLALAPAAFADSTVASATTSSTAHSATVRPYNGANCTAMLIIYGYKVTGTRGLICYVAASPLGTPQARYLACASAMVVTGVGIIAANSACAVAVA